MLGTLLKHDFRAARILLPVYAAFAALTASMALTIAFDFASINSLLLNLLNGTLLFLFVLSIFAMIFATIAYVIIRFYKNLVGDEGYLMFTLPVTPGQLLLSKTISGMLLMWASILAVFLSIFALFWASGTLPELIALFKETSGATEMLRIIFSMLSCIPFSALLAIMTIYAGISFGQSLGQNRLLGSIGGTVIIYLALQLLSTALLVTFFAFGDNLFPQAAYLTDMEAIGAISYIFWGTNVLLTVYSAILYGISHFFLSKKLNLC